MKKQQKMMWLCVVFMLLSMQIAIAQTITGTVRGTVTDPSGAVIAGAKVSARNVNTGVTSNTVSNREGLYNIQFLPIGEYTITASASGFQTTSIGPLRLQIDQIAKIDAMLKVGKSATTLTIAASAAPLLNTENSTLGTSVDSHTLQNMPLPGLNVNYATMFVPGTVLPTVGGMGSSQATGRDAGGSTGQGSQVVPSFNGNRQQTNNYILDGMEINETLNNLIGYNPSPFSLQEVRVITGNADAEYGNVNGGEVVMVTKGGTNQFHGSAFEYFQNQNLAANTWANNLTGLPKAKITNNQFGATIGGPLLRNKLFFFGDYEGVRSGGPANPTLVSVPTAAERTGDFSALLNIEGTQLYDTSNGTLNATPYANNQIPIDNPVAKFLFAHPEALPLPNHPPTSGVTYDNYQGYSKSLSNNDQGDIRIDYALNAKNSLMGKYTVGDAYDRQSQVPLPVQFPIGDDYPFHSAVLNWVYTLSPSLVNEARAGFSRVVWNQGVPSDPSGLFGKNGDQVVGIPLANQPIVGFTYMNFQNASSSGFTSYGVKNNAGNFLADNNFSYGDNLTWQHGNHVTKFGVQFVRYQQNFFTPSNLGGLLGAFNYSGTFTSGSGSGGNPFADFVVDKAASAQISGVNGPFGQRQWRNAFYVQDDWKVRPNLTLNLGVRYAYDQATYEVHNRMVSVDLKKAYFAAPGTPFDSLLLYAGKNGNSRALYNAYPWQVMPRFGFALQLNPRLVVRGGYGITEAMEGTGTGLRMTQNPPFQASFSYSAAPPSASSGGTYLQAGNGFTSVQTSGNNTDVFSGLIDIWDPNLRPAVVQQFNLTTQYAVNDNTSLQVGYVGQLGQHLAVPLALNQYTAPVPSTCANPDPNDGCTYMVAPYYSLVGAYGYIIETVSQGIENYNALQAVLQHQESNGLEFQLNYTWSKAMTNNVGFYGVNGSAGTDSFWQNTYDPQADYGPSSYDVRHNLTGTMIYQLPFGRQKKFGGNWNRATDAVLGGWSLSGAAMLTSGLPISIQTFNVNNELNPPGNLDGTERANHYFPLKIVHQSVTHWFGTDPSATPCKGDGQMVNSLGANCAYGQPSASEFGSASPSTERAPGYRQIDLSLFKAFQTYKSQTVKFRVDAFNAFNIASYGPPGQYIDSSRFGKIFSTLSPPRQLQLSVIYQF
ncbi:MAG: TonB-dependent receptor [Acidobacteriaceae bacterium]